MAGAIASVVGLTGAMVAFEPELDRALNPWLFHAAPAANEPPLTRVIATATEGWEARPWNVRYPQAPDEAYKVELSNGREVGSGARPRTDGCWAP